MNQIDKLEKKCRNLLRRKDHVQDHAMPVALVDREMNLILDQIDAVRRQDLELRNRLDEQRLEIESRILNQEPLLHHSSQFWFERKRLTNQLKYTLVRLEQQIFRFTIENQKSIHTLQKRLLELWNMHDQLSQNGTFSDSA